MLAGGRGFEPRLAGPEPAVLPLYDPPSVERVLTNSTEKSREKPSFILEAKQTQGKILISFNHFPAPDHMVFADPMETDLTFAATVFYQWASSLELTSGWRIERAWDIP